MAERALPPLQDQRFLMNKDNEVLSFFPAAAAVCLLNFNLSVGAKPTACTPHVLADLTLHFFLLTRYFCCHFVTSGALRASHQRISVGISAICLSLVTFSGIRKNIVVQACCGHSPLCSSPRIPRFLLSFLLSSPVALLGWKPSHPTPVFA